MKRTSKPATPKKAKTPAPAPEASAPAAQPQPDNSHVASLEKVPQAVTAHLGN